MGKCYIVGEKSQPSLTHNDKIGMEERRETGRKGGRDSPTIRIKPVQLIRESGPYNSWGNS